MPDKSDILILNLVLHRVNVLLAVDEVQALFMTSEYRTPDYTLLESYALSVPRLLLDYISGRKALVSLSLRLI